MNIHKSQLFWCELQGYKVLTHCHIYLSHGFILSSLPPGGDFGAAFPGATVKLRQRFGWRHGWGQGGHGQGNPRQRNGENTGSLEGKRWKHLGKPWRKMGKLDLEKVGMVLNERWEFGWRNREFQLGKTLDFRCSANKFNQNAWFNFGRGEA